jgi:hypothetical protein
MCGRYRRTTAEEELARRYHVPIPTQRDLPISWNIAPSQDVLSGEKRPPDFDRKAEPFSGVSPSGTLKVVFHLELLSAQASPQLREPDKLRTFVSSPFYWVGVIV